MMRRSLALLALLWGCGADDAPLASPHGGGSGGGGSAGLAGGSGASLAGGSGGAGLGGAAGSAGDEAPRLARGLRLEGLLLYQAVEVALLRQASVVAERNAPVVAGRGAVVRALARPEAGFVPAKYRAELRVEAPGLDAVVLTDEQSLAGDPGSEPQFRFELAPSMVRPETRLTARLIDDGAEPQPGPSLAQAPPLDLAAEWPGGALRVALVPLRYDADGSGRLPDTSDEQIERYRALLRAVYPVINVELEVRDPVPWDQALNLAGNVKFGALNNLLADLRAADKAPTDVYYYGLISPAENLDAYCGDSCVTGQSFVVVDPADDGSRVGAGMGFSGDDSAWTLAHELAHMHGRRHAPCGVAGEDPEFPYKNGGIGVRGHDERTGGDIEPDEAHDLLSYCGPL